MNFNISGMEKFEGSCKAFVVWNEHDLRIAPWCSNDTRNHTFVCMEGMKS